MNPDTVLTIGLGSLIVVCIGGGVGVVVWLYGKFKEIEDAMREAIQDARSDGDNQIARLDGKIEEVSSRQQRHELHVEQNFLSKSSANAFFGRVEKAIDEMRGDIRELVKGVAGLRRDQ